MKPRLRAIVSLILLALVLWRLDLVRTVSLLTFLRLDWLLVTFGVLVAGIFWSAWKWKILATPLGVGKPYLTLLRWYFIGSFFNHFLPTAVGGDVVRVAMLSKSTGKTAAAFSSVFMERLTGLAALILIAIVASLFYPVPPDLRFLLPVYGIMLGVMAAGLVWLFRRSPEGMPEGKGIPDGPSTPQVKLRHYLSLWTSQIGAYRTQPRALVTACVFSIVFQLQVIVSARLVASTLGIGLSWQACFLCIPLATLATMIPISINGIGVRESAYVLLFTRAGLSSEQAFLIGFGTFVYVLLVNMVGGTLSLLTEKETLPR